MHSRAFVATGSDYVGDHAKNCSCFKVQRLRRISTCTAYFFTRSVISSKRSRPGCSKAIHWINHYPADSVVCFVEIAIYPVDTIIQSLSNWGLITIMLVKQNCSKLPVTFGRCQLTFKTLIILKPPCIYRLFLTTICQS